MGSEMRRYGWLANVAMATIVRRLTYLALAAVLGYFSIAKASAQTNCGLPYRSNELLNSGQNTQYATKVQALAACNSMATQVITGSGGSGWFARGTRQACVANLEVKTVSVTWNGTTSFHEADCSGAYAAPGTTVDSGWGYVADGPNCTAPQVLNPATNQCWVPPDEDDCLARNTDAKKPNIIQFSGTACMNGCSYGPTKLGFTRVINGVTYRSGEMGYTGQTCNVPPPTPPPEPEKPAEPKCIPIEGQTVCIQPEDNKLCYTGGSATSMVCWPPGETGEKTDGPIKHVVAPGTNPGTPSPPLPGDTQTPTGTPVTITTTGPGGTSTTTHSTTTTGSGNNAGPGGFGQLIGSKGGPDGKDESKGTASGGADCKTAPTCAGDAILCAINENAWRAGCRGDKNGDGRPDWTENKGEVPGPPGGDDGETGIGEVGVNTGMLDTENIFGSGSCPILTVTIRGVATSSDSIPQWCNIVLVMRSVVLLMGAFAAIKILLGA